MNRREEVRRLANGHAASCVDHLPQSSFDLDHHVQRCFNEMSEAVGDCTDKQWEVAERAWLSTLKRDGITRTACGWERKVKTVKNRQSGWGWLGDQGYCPDCACGEQLMPFTDGNHGYAVDYCCNCGSENPNYDEEN